MASATHLQKGATMHPQTYTFEVVPTGWNGGRADDLAFEPFLLEVPSSAHQMAARRAYFTAMSYLRDTAEPGEGFQVFCYDGHGARGAEVLAGGIVGVTPGLVA